MPVMSVRPEYRSYRNCSNGVVDFINYNFGLHSAAYYNDTIDIN